MSSNPLPAQTEAFVPPELAWRRLVRRTRTRVNLGWVADALIPLCIGSGAVACAALLLLRSLHRLPPPASPATIGLGCGSLLLIIGLAYFRSRRRFLTLEAACTRLDAHLGLHNALTAADRGLRTWPPPPSLPRHPPGGLQWNWLSLAAPPALAGLLAALPFLLPSPAREESPPPAGEPLAWETMDQWLNQLQEERLANPDDLRDFQQVLSNLRETPPAERFRNASLEATDALQQKLERAVQELASDLSRSAQAMSLLEADSSQLSAADRQALQDQLRQSIERLGAGELGLHPSRLEPLGKLDPSSLSGNPASGKALSENLRRNAQALQDLLRQSDARSQQWERKLQADNLFGESGTGASGTCPGMGAPQRGPGEAPLTYAADPVDLGTDSPEPLAGTDPARAAPGDLLKVDYAKPPVAPASTSGGAAGVISAPGQGGQEIWRPALLPAEQAVLRRYFR